jgi:hypothetical protein
VGGCMFNELEFENTNVTRLNKLKNYLFISLDNNKNILTNGNEVYDITGYNNAIDIFNMQDRLCAVLINNGTTYVVDLDNMEVLFEEYQTYHIRRIDDNILYVIRSDNSKNLYDINKQTYISQPNNYEFEKSLGRNLYVLCEKNKYEDIYNTKRCIINNDGKVILDDISGWIEICDNYLIIEKSDSLSIIDINDATLTMNTIEKTDKSLIKPEYYNGKIILLESGLLKIFNPDLSLVKEIKIDGLDSIIDYELVGNTLKLCIPYNINDNHINKHLFINLDNGNIMSHTRIECYPYWTPSVYVGKDNDDDEYLTFEYGKTYDTTVYHFYDSNYNNILNIEGNNCISLDNENEFIVGTWNGKSFIKKIINTKNSNIIDCNYSIVKFSSVNNYGYAFNDTTDMMDIIDENLNAIIPNIDYKKYGLSKNNDISSNFDYFVVNNYVCITKHIADGPRSYYRYIIQDSDGNIILDSLDYKCNSVGNLIQIVGKDKVTYLNTLTGEIGDLSINGLSSIKRLIKK